MIGMHLVYYQVETAPKGVLSCMADHIGTYTSYKNTPYHMTSHLKAAYKCIANFFLSVQVTYLYSTCAKQSGPGPTACLKLC